MSRGRCGRRAGDRTGAGRRRGDRQRGLRLPRRRQGLRLVVPGAEAGQRRTIRTDVAVLYVGDEAEKQALLKGEPELFFTTDGYDGWPLVMLRLDEVDVVRLEELVTDAWRMRRGDPVP